MRRRDRIAFTILSGVALVAVIWFVFIGSYRV